MLEELTEQAKLAVEQVLDAAKLERGGLFVVGCSSSEVCGSKIGTNSSLETAQAVFAGIYPVLKERGIYLAAQCCEHLNRAIIIEREAAQKFGYEEVNVVPQPKAGGSFATTAYATFAQPVAVEGGARGCGDGYWRHTHWHASQAGGGSRPHCSQTNWGGEPALCTDEAKIYRRRAGTL